jgi:hypothetical protein
MLTLEVVPGSRAAPVAAMANRPAYCKSGRKSDGYGCAFGMAKALSEESRQSRSAIDLKRTLSPSAPEDSTVHSRALPAILALLLPDCRQLRS